MGINVSDGVGMHVQGDKNEILPFCHLATKNDKQPTTATNSHILRTNTVLEYSI